MEGVELTNKHKLLLGVVGVGAAALIVDRFVLNSSAPASASAAPAALAATRPQESPVQAPVQEGAADRLQRLAGSQPVPTSESQARVASAFTSPVQWLPEAQRKQAVEVRSSAPRAHSDLAGQFRLSSVFTIGPGYATINGKNVAVGSESKVLGLKLVSIEAPARDRAASAVVEYRGQQFHLSTQFADGTSGVSPRR